MSDNSGAGRATGVPGRGTTVVREILEGNGIISVLAILIAVLIGGLLIAVTDSDVQHAASYFFARPTDTIGAIWSSISQAYVSLFQGAIYNPAIGGIGGFSSLLTTVNMATPLIAAGLGVALGFRVGLFNIGGRGQMLIAAGLAGLVSTSISLPWGVHMVVAVAAGLAGGALWGGIVGVLKARTGAHEVILTIMLNYVAFYLISFLLRTPVLQAPGSSNPKSAPAAETAVLPSLLGGASGVNFGFVLSIAATVFVWWLLGRSSLGFRMRAVGLNPVAARVAGIRVERMYIYAMLFAGALAGLAGAQQVLGTITSGFTSGIDSGIGFDAITVALLGRSTPWGTFAAGLLFGAFKAGGYAMSSEGIPLDIVLVVQSFIVLFIAAPPLIRGLFRLPKPGSGARASRKAVI